jgi:hypothetical protein
MIIPKTNPWSCLLASFSMATNIPTGILVNTIGHDGSSLPYEDQKYHAGFHPQECIDAIMKFGWEATPIELYPKITPNRVEERIIYFNGDDSGNWARFLRHLSNTTHGVLEGLLVRKDKIAGHAVAWDGLYIHDPRGYSYSFSEHDEKCFCPQVLWRLTNNGGANEI